MDSRKINEDKVNENMGQTVFGNQGTASWFNPIGMVGNWFNRFFASKSQPYVAQQANPGPTPIHPLGGDTIVSPDVTKGDGNASWVITSVKLAEIEISRKLRNSLLEQMDEYPEIGAAFDIYADDCTQKDISGERWKIHSDSSLAINEIKNLFNTIKLDRVLWDLSRNTVKYGDCFIELVLDVNNPKKGIQRIKVLNPNHILRIENEYGYLTDFLQEIPSVTNDWSSFGLQGAQMNKSQYISLDKNQIVHFRLFTSDPKFYPYGKSIAAYAIRVFRSLKLMEDAMLVYRLTRAPERRVFYINTGSLPTGKAEAFVQSIQRKFKKEKVFSTLTGNIDEKLNPMSFDEDFFIPHRGDKETKIEVLPGAQNLGEVDDVKYFRDKLLACLKIPKDYVVEHDKSPERKANLSQLDVKFARVIMRVQQQIEVGLETIARRHLIIKGYPAYIVNNLRITLPDPSDMFTKRRLDVDDQKTRVIQAVKGLQLFSNDYIYKEYYQMTDKEISDMKSQLKKEMSEQAAMGGMGMPGMGMPGMGMGAPGMPPNPDGSVGEIDMGGGGDPNGIESAENKPPTSESYANLAFKSGFINEETYHRLDKIKKKYQKPTKS